MKRLPIGIQTFRQIREQNYVYVDKTKEVINLINNYKYVFLSRPRRFGKSLFLDTLKETFEGNKELFEGLYIYDKYDFESFPVIKISWSGNFQTLEKLEETAIDIFKQNQRKLGIKCDNTKSPESCFRQLIELSYEKYKKTVVILVDEYDKPILDVIDNIEQAKINREFLKGLYTIIKDYDAYIRFAFLTGVSRFSRVSIFSGLNNLEDISLNPNFAYICGFTHNDLLTEFKDYLQDIDLEQVRKWYNGYNFLGEEKVYNP
ncbi:ATP-binding protein, partial [Persephonella sp.]